MFVKAMIDLPEKKIEAPFQTFEVETLRFPPHRVVGKEKPGESNSDYSLYNVDLERTIFCHAVGSFSLVAMRVGLFDTRMARLDPRNKSMSCVIYSSILPDSLSIFSSIVPT